jgi:hypothetical protein
LREGGGVGGGVKKTNKVQGGGDCSKSEAQLWVCGENSWHQVRKLYGDSSAPKPLKYLDEGFPQSRRNNASGSSSSKTVRKKTQKGAGDHFMCENCGKVFQGLEQLLSHQKRWCMGYQPAVQPTITAATRANQLPEGWTKTKRGSTKRKWLYVSADGATSDTLEKAKAFVAKYSIRDSMPACEGGGEIEPEESGSASKKQRCDEAPPPPPAQPTPSSDSPLSLSALPPSNVVIAGGTAAPSTCLDLITSNVSNATPKPPKPPKFKRERAAENWAMLVSTKHATERACLDDAACTVRDGVALAPSFASKSHRCICAKPAITHHNILSQPCWLEPCCRTWCLRRAHPTRLVCVFVFLRRGGASASRQAVLCIEVVYFYLCIMAGRNYPGVRAI